MSFLCKKMNIFYVDISFMVKSFLLLKFTNRIILLAIPNLKIFNDYKLEFSIINNKGTAKVLFYYIYNNLCNLWLNFIKIRL